MGEQLIEIFRFQVDDFDAGKVAITRSASDALLLDSAVAAGGPAFFISPTGNDTTGDGTQTNPWQSHEKARDEMAASGTVKRTFARGGIYARNAPLILDADDANQTWEGFAGELPIIEGQNFQINLFQLNNAANNISLINYRFQNTTGGDITNSVGAIRAPSGTVADLIVERCIFDSINRGISSSATITDWLILENTFSDILFGCVRYNGTTTGGFVAGNTASNVLVADIGGTEGLLFMAGAPAVNVTAEYNSCDGCNSRWLGSIDENQNNVIFQYNVLKNFGQSGTFGDAGCIYTFGRPSVHNQNSHYKFNWIEGAVGGSPFLTSGIYLDDSATGCELFGNVFINCANHSVHLHGGNDNTIRNNIMLLREGTTNGGEADERALFNQADSTFGGTGTGNIFDRNILLSVDQNLNRISYQNTTGSNNYILKGGTLGDPTTNDNVLWQDIATESFEVSSVQQDPDFHTYDPANNVLRLNRISRGDASNSPAYGEGFVDIAGVTDGAAFEWGVAGYDRANY